MWDTWIDPWVGKIPWRRAWYPTPAFLPGESSWTEEPGGLQSMEFQRVAHNLMTKSNTACIYKASSVVPIENNAMLCYQNHYLKTILLYQYIIHSLLISC